MFVTLKILNPFRSYKIPFNYIFFTFIVNINNEKKRKSNYICPAHQILFRVKDFLSLF